MVCALHRLFQTESDDRVMEHGFDPDAGDEAQPGARDPPPRGKRPDRTPAGAIRRLAARVRGRIIRRRPFPDAG